MKKNRENWRNGGCLLIGVFLYSLLFLASKGKLPQTFGIIIVALLTLVSYRLENPGKEGSKIHSLDIVFLSIGIILDALFEGFPFNLLLK